ncbi:TIGR03915 family putative DNA repair protein [Hydrogenobaculum acidophilum]
MVNIIFEDSFEGFLSALFYAFNNDIKNPIFLKAQKPSLFKTVKVDLDESIIEKAKSLLEDDIIELFYDCFCFDEEKAFSDVYKSFLFYMKNKHLKDIYKDFIRNLVYYRKSVNRERHKYIGFLRFHQVDNILYAKFEPKHFVLDYLGEFFKKRYQEESFIIHDIKRRKAAVYYEKNLSIEVFDKEVNVEKDTYQKLWKAFFEAVTIKERANKRLQNHYVPNYFRKHMIEFNH